MTKLANRDGLYGCVCATEGHGPWRLLSRKAVKSARNQKRNNKRQTKGWMGGWMNGWFGSLSFVCLGLGGVMWFDGGWWVLLWEERIVNVGREGDLLALDVDGGVLFDGDWYDNDPWVVLSWMVGDLWNWLSLTCKNDWKRKLVSWRELWKRFGEGERWSGRWQF